MKLETSTLQSYGTQQMNFNHIQFRVILDIILKFWFNYISISILSAVSFVLQTAGASIIISLFTKSVVFPYNIYSYIGDNLGDYFLVITSFLLVVLSSIAIFYAKKNTIDIMIGYEKICSNKLFFNFLHNINSAGCLTDSEVIRLMSKDCRFGGRIAQEISGLVMPASIFIVAIPILLYINHSLTIGLLFAIVISFVPYIKISAKAKSISLSFETSAITDAKYKKDALIKYRKNNSIDRSISFPHKDFKDNYKKRLLIPHLGIVLGGVQIGFCILILGFWVVYSNGDAVRVDSSIVYGFISLLLLNQVRTIAKAYANFQVFVTYFQRVFSMIIGVECIPERPKDDKQSEYTDFDL